MPVVGFISTNGESDQPEGQGHCSFAYALQLSAERDEAFPYPYPLMKGIVDSIQDRGEYISVTSILHCIRGDFLKRTEPYYMTVDAAYPMFRGTLFHSLLEKNPAPDGRIEEKTIRKYRGIEIGGTFDSLLTFQDADLTVLQDWKTTDTLPKFGAYTSHIAQVNLYRWLLGLDPDKCVLEVHYFSMKGHKACVLKDGKQATRGGRAAVNQHWTDAQVEAYLDDRLVKLRASFVSRIAMPYAMVPEDDKWECAYCPVKATCDERAADEAESLWRQKAGLPPTGAVGDEAAAWLQVVEGVTARLPKKKVTK